MNNYNPEWIFSWNANTDLQITLDFFEIISYITDYVGKLDDDTIVHLKEAKKEMMDLNMKEQLRKMADIFLTHRRVGQAESLYRIDPAMHLTDSNVKCVYVATGWPEDRYVFAQKISDDTCNLNEIEDDTIYQIKGREGLYKETPTLLSKYERRGTKNNLDKLCYAQFCKEYDPYRKPKGKKTKGFLDREESSSDEDDNNSGNEKEVESDKSFGTEHQEFEVS